MPVSFQLVLRYIVSRQDNNQEEKLRCPLSKHKTKQTQHNTKQNTPTYSEVRKQKWDSEFWNPKFSDGCVCCWCEHADTHWKCPNMSKRCTVSHHSVFKLIVDNINIYNLVFVCVQLIAVILVSIKHTFKSSTNQKS